MNCIAVVTTVGSRDDARRIGRSLVERGLAACAQISAIESFYVWDGTLQDDAEFRLVLKTVDARYADVERAVRELHPYELPAIFAVPLGPVFGPYADWVADGSQGEDEGASARTPGRARIDATVRQAATGEPPSDREKPTP